MESGGEGGAGTQPVVYCIVPRELAAKLHDHLRDCWRDDPSVRVVVEHRRAERRRAVRRDSDEAAAPADDRRRVRSLEGRRVADRRALTVPAGAPPLPRRAKRYAHRLTFVERVEPEGPGARDADSQRLVVRYQSGDESAIGELYLRYFDDVYLYACVALEDHHEAEDVVQQVFMRALGALRRYEIRAGTPFRSWLFRIARNVVIDAVAEQQRVLPEAPDRIDLQRDSTAHEAAASTLDWLSDREVALFVGRLPEAQRRVLALRFMLDLTTDEIAALMDRSPSAVRQLQSRALQSLEARLGAVGRGSRRSRRAPMLVRVKPMPVTVPRRFALGRPGRSRADQIR